MAVYVFILYILYILKILCLYIGKMKKILKEKNNS